MTEVLIRHHNDYFYKKIRIWWTSLASLRDIISKEGYSGVLCYYNKRLKIFIKLDNDLDVLELEKEDDIIIEVV